MGKKQTTSRKETQRAPRGGFGWLFLLLITGGLLALFVYAPHVITNLGSAPRVPSQLGDQPLDTQDQSADVMTRDVAIEARSLAGDVSGLAQRQDDPVEEAPSRPMIDDPVEESFQDAARGQDILGRAEEAYASYRWEEARSLASSLRGLAVEPAVRLRADDIVDGTRRLEALFQALGTREELTRNLETHPSLVEVVQRGRPNRVVPIASMNEQEPLKLDDPVTWLREQLASAGEVAVLLESRIATMLSAAEVSEVRSAQVDDIIAERRQTMERRVGEFEADPELRDDPMAWYEAARFAYQNHIDDKVVDMLDRALLLSPDLAQTIREDAAQDWFARMIVAMENENRNAATGFMRQIQRYEDTMVYAQARAFYDGNMDELRRAREEAMAQQRAQREAVRERQLQRAQAQGDDQEVERIQERERQQERGPRVASQGDGADTSRGDDRRGTPAPTGSGDMASANASFDKGMEIYQRAQSMGATRDRDQAYREARKHFLAALQVYSAAVEAGDTSVESRMIQTNQLQYACMKYARSF